ncbi:MAG: hypothetical protein KDK62_01595 [Chlamydiia bacterium]|nr:hypothetical protein [Chlamydiia bacterium]
MFRYYILIATLLSFSSQAVEIQIRSGAGQGDLHWAIGTSDRSISTLSTLKWKRLEYVSYGGEGLLRFWSSGLVLLGGDYGSIFSGINEDSDFSKNGREGLYSFSKAKSNKGEIFDLYGAFGIESCNFGLYFQIFAGWAHAEQHVRQMSPASFYYNGNNDPFDPVNVIITGQIQNLHSNYRALWHGPWIGFRVLPDFGRFHLKLGFEYHRLCYHGTGNWNLREDLARKFKHYGSGNGFKVLAEGAFDLTPSSKIGLRFDASYYHLNGGVDRVSYYDNQAILTAEVPLNEVTWNTGSIKLFYERVF